VPPIFTHENLFLPPSPEADIQAEPQGVAEGQLLGLVGGHGVVQLDDGLHQLDEHVADVVLPPAVQGLAGIAVSVTLLCVLLGVFAAISPARER